jgi:predicted transcriptional regulator
MGGPEQNGYTTVSKMLQIMMEKGLAVRDESQWPHVYAPTRTEEQTQRQLVGHLLDRAFGGSAAQLVLRALSTRRASAAEIAEVRGMLDQLSTRQTKGEKS